MIISSQNIETFRYYDIGLVIEANTLRYGVYGFLDVYKTESSMLMRTNLPRINGAENELITSIYDDTGSQYVSITNI